MNFITKTISKNPRVYSQFKEIPSYKHSAFRDSSFSSIRFFSFHCPVTSYFENEDRRKDSRIRLDPLKSVDHEARTALFASLPYSTSFNSPAFGLKGASKFSCFRPYSTVDESSSSPRSKEKAGNQKDSFGSLSESSDHITKSQKAKEVVKKGASSMSETIKKYGWPFIVTYLGVYFATLSSLFIAVDTGAIDPVTIVNIEFPWHSSGMDDSNAADKESFDSAVEFISSYMKKFSWTEPYADTALKNPHMTNLAISWIAVKFTEPLRLAASLGIVRQITKEKKIE